MKIETSGDLNQLYFRIRANWIKEAGSYNRFDWAADFALMLEHYGGRIEPAELDFSETNVGDGVGIVLSKQWIEFDNEQDYLLFLLKWA